tara:strand:+ start:185 stop:496 length:312 start_codon:yes stop_codon:yes gene_type:complete
MKLIKQISTGRTVHREEPHGDKSINNASLFTGIALEDLQVADDNITEDQYAARINDELLPLDKIAQLESTITPRRLRDAIANDAGKSWVAAVEALIDTERGKL